MSRVKDMTQGNPTKLIFSFAFPLIIGNLGQQLYMITDTIIVGQGVGLSALASLGATDWIYWLVLWSVQYLTQGFGVLITQNIGEGNETKIRKSIIMSAILCGVIGTSISIIFPMLASPFLWLLHTPADIFDSALSYVKIMYAGTLIVMGYNMTSAVLRAFGDGKTPLIAMIVAAVINIGLDLLFVMVFKWGIVGAAIATIFSQFVSCVYMLWVICHIPVLKFTREDWKPDGVVIRKLIALGAPLALAHVAIVIGGIYLQFMINGFGSNLVAAFTASNKINGLLESSAISFGFATATYMGQNWGAKKFDRIKQGLCSALLLAISFAIGIAVLMIAFGKNILMLFIDASDANAPIVLDLAYQYLIILCSTLVILYVLHVYRSSIQGMGNTIIPMISGFLECVGRVSVAFFMPKLIGETGLFWAESVAWLFSASFLVFSYYKHFNKKSIQPADHEL